MNWKAQSRKTCHPASTILLKLATPFTKQRGEMDTIEAPTMESPRSPTMDEITPRCNHQGVPNQQHSSFKPSVTICPDACKYSIGGYSNNGLEWRCRIPSAWHRKLILNLLELLASSISIYMNLLQLGHGSQILAFTDSSSALGWMQKAFFDPVNKESKDTVSRWLGWTFFSN